MAVTVRRVADSLPVTGDVLIRNLDDPENLHTGWTLGGNARDGWFGYRHYDPTVSYHRTDYVITPVDWKRANCGSAVEALTPAAAVERPRED